jgi:type 1 glutamine amidotransferase
MIDPAGLAAPVRIASKILIAAGLAFASPVVAQAIDCPMRDQPYSVDAPLIDVLLNPAAKAAIDREAPDLLKSLPPRMFGTTAPSFAAILTPRTLVDLKRSSQAPLVALDKALHAVPVTVADKVARCARYDVDRPAIAVPAGKPRLLLFEKMTGFRDGPSVEAARAAFEAMAKRHGWALVVTDKGGAIDPKILKQFDAVIWNNVSGDVLTLRQRTVLRGYIEGGGGFVGVHGSGGDPATFWDWYVDRLIGARFLGHPLNPQFQDARVKIDDPKNAIAAGLPGEWTMSDEWYSFKSNPRSAGAHVVATLDESSYSPKEMGRDIGMGADHPIAWTRCVGNGRSFYSAIGHRPETYSEAHVVTLLEQAIGWAAGKGATRCVAGKEVAAK